MWHLRCSAYYSSSIVTQVCLVLVHVNTEAVCLRIRGLTSQDEPSHDVHCSADEDAAEDVTVDLSNGSNKVSISCPPFLQDYSGHTQQKSVFTPLNPSYFCGTDTVSGCTEKGAERRFTSVFDDFKTSWWTMDKNDGNSRILTIPREAHPVKEDTITLGCRTTLKATTVQTTTTHNCSVRIHVFSRKHYETGQCPAATSFRFAPVCVITAVLASLWGAIPT